MNHRVIATCELSRLVTIASLAVSTLTLSATALSAAALSDSPSQVTPANSHFFSPPFAPTVLSDLTNISRANPVGTIQGTVIYPSEILPAQRVCAVNLQTRGAYCTETGEEQSQFSLPVIPGTYHVYAIACRDYQGQVGTRCQNRNYDDQIRAYYDEFVTCGLYANCSSKLPIFVTVRAGETVTGVSPHDWYP